MHDQIIEFLENFQWVYDFKWTEISLLKQWNKIPSSWMLFFENMKFEEIKQIVSCDFSLKPIPIDIQKFFLFHKEISNLVRLQSNLNESSSDSFSFNLKKINFKKSHELINITSFLSHFIENKVYLKEKSEINILDIGSGLGHLPRILEKNLKSSCEVSVMAVEGNPDLHNRNNCTDNIQKLNFFITNENLPDFNNEINAVFSKIDVITGLHCCGVLSSLMLKFFATSSADSLLLLSCCYHRMFRNGLNGFPLSRIYQQKQRDKMIDFVTAMFLRLGCQETKETWLKWSADDYYHHQYTVAFRCATEEYMSRTNEDLTRLKRVKFNRHNVALMSFSEFVKMKIDEFHIKDQTTFLEIVEEQEKCCHWYSIVLALQMAIQEIIEYFILLDRVLYLKEFDHIKTVELVRLFDPSISPRHIAIFANK